MIIPSIISFSTDSQVNLMLKKLKKKYAQGFISKKSSIYIQSRRALSHKVLSTEMNFNLWKFKNQRTKIPTFWLNAYASGLYLVVLSL